jgi:U3 small nucleolar RNA-associated protein 21
VYKGHKGNILQLLSLGDHLVSLGADAKLLLWKTGEYDAPQVIT